MRKVGMAKRRVTRTRRKIALDSRACARAARVERVEAAWMGWRVNGPREVIWVRRVRRVKPVGEWGT